MGSEGLYGVEGGKGIPGGEVVVDGGLALGEQGCESGAVGDGLVRGDGEGPAEGTDWLDAGPRGHGL